jgi:hypothetical protein
MAAWLPVLKIALPYVSNIVAAAIPAFTRRKTGEASDELVTRQIAELQEAVTGNAETVRVLAAQVEKTLKALETGEAEAAQRLTQQLAGLHDGVARTEGIAHQAQAQITRLDGLTAALQMRIGELELQHQRQGGVERRREYSIAGLAVLAALLAIIALLR